MEAENGFGGLVNAVMTGMLKSLIEYMGIMAALIAQEEKY
jgi:hypothetical protein